MKIPASLALFLSFERVLLLRHLAFSVSVVFAFVYGDRLGIGNSFLAVAGAAVALNLAVGMLPRRRLRPLLPEMLSLVIGVAGWCCLAHLSGGVKSPFALGPGIEILLSILAGSLSVTFLVTAAGIGGLWVQQALFVTRTRSDLPYLFLATTLFLFMGALAAAAVLRWRKQQEEMRRHSLDLGRRVSHLEEELETLRPLGRFGEDWAQVAHALKGAVGNLRGYCQLLEMHPDGSDASRQAWDGLRHAVERLESTTLETLKPLRRDTVSLVSCGEVRRLTEAAMRQVAERHPGVHWHLADGPWEDAALRVPPRVLQEVLVLLAQNAAEAMGGRGRVTLISLPAGPDLQIEIRDEGPGVHPAVLPALFQPGVTTKDKGSGMGLFLARRMVESHGGSLVAASAGMAGGATFLLKLPLANPARS
jgi:signal transduction histidine kinase